MRSLFSGRVVAACVLAALGAPTLASAQDALNLDCRGGRTSGEFEIGVVLDVGEPYTVVMTDMTTGQELAGSRREIDRSATPTNYGCHYYAYYDNVDVGIVPNRVQFLPDRLYRIDMFPTYEDSNAPRASFYDFHGVGCAPGSSVFCTRGYVGDTPDVVFFVGATSIETYVAGLLTPQGFGAPGTSVEDVVGYSGDVDAQGFAVPNPWVLPYDKTVYCALRALPCHAPDPNSASHDGNVMFVTRVPFGSGPATLPVSLSAAIGADWRVQAGRTYTWSSSDVSQVRYGPGGRLTVKGVLNTSGVTFTASNPAVGWAGVRFEANSGGAWTGAFVERVAGPGPEDPSGMIRQLPTHAVRVTDASPTFMGVTVQDPASGTGPVDGFYVSETATPQNPVVIADPVIQEMGGSGIVANGGARVEVVRGDVTFSGGTAVKAGGAGSVVYLAPAVPRTPGTQITDNPGGGVLAASGGAVRFSQPAGGDGFATVALNPGRGLVATGGGVVYAGSLTVNRKNRIFLNGGGASAGNARASGTSSRIYARCAWWNQETFPYRTAGVSGGLVDVSGALSQDPYANPNAPCPDGSTIDGRPGVGASVALRGGATAAGRDGVTALDRLAEALGAATAAETVTLLAGLVADEPTAAESAAALAEAGGIAGQAGAPLSAVALLGEATTSPYRALRVAAWQALVASRQAQGDRTGALAAADALAGEGAAAAVQAELAHVYLHAASADSASAWESLASLEALAPASVELGLARSFLGLGGEPEDEGRGAGAAAETALVGVQAVDGAGEAVTLAVGPNPAASSSVVSLTLAEAGEASVVVYDLLGRTVATVLSGSYAEGTHRVALDASRLAPGVYVVRASAATAAGPAVRTARLTVVR